MQRRPYRHGETPADARERRRAFARELRTRVPLDRGLDRSTASSLSRLDEIVERRLASGDHDLLLDETRVSAWPRQTAHLATEVDAEIEASVVAGSDPVAIARAIAANLTARFGFAPHASPTERALVLRQAVASAQTRLAGHGWERDVLSAEPDTLARLFDEGEGGSSVVDVTRHSGRVHLELRGRSEARGAAGTSYAVLSRAGRLVVVDDARRRFETVGDAVRDAFTDVAAALGALEAFRETGQE